MRETNHRWSFRIVPVVVVALHRLLRRSKAENRIEAKHHRNDRHNTHTVAEAAALTEQMILLRGVQIGTRGEVNAPAVHIHDASFHRRHCTKQNDRAEEHMIGHKALLQSNVHTG